MSSEALLSRFRRVLLLIVASICVGSILELIFAEHTQETLQWIPFIMAVAGFIAVALAWFNPKRRSIRIMRVVMLLMAAGSLWGIYLHFINNFEFELEINATATAVDVIIPALMGANPLFAPGILLLGGVLGLLATWHHPTLERQSESD